MVMFSIPTGMSGELNNARTIMIHPDVPKIGDTHLSDMICSEFLKRTDTQEMFVLNFLESVQFFYF